MADEMLSALIGAGAALGAVYLGSKLTHWQEGRKERRRLEQERYYLTAVLGQQLDRFASGCLDVSYDDGTSEGRPSNVEFGYELPTVSAPTFDPLALQNVDWKALPVDLMHAILALPANAAELERSLDDPGLHDPPEFPAMFAIRQPGYAELGLEAAVLARRLRSLVGVPPPPLPPHWRPREAVLRERCEQLERAEIAYNKRWIHQASAMPSPTPVAQP